MGMGGQYPTGMYPLPSLCARWRRPGPGGGQRQSGGRPQAQAMRKAATGQGGQCRPKVAAPGRRRARDGRTSGGAMGSRRDAYFYPQKKLICQLLEDG